MKKCNEKTDPIPTQDSGLLRIMVFATILSFAFLGVAVVSLQDFIDKGEFDINLKVGVAALIGGVVGWLIWKIPNCLASSRGK